MTLQKLAFLSVLAFVPSYGQIINGGGGGGGGGSGSVTSVATSCGVSGGPITTTGTLLGTGTCETITNTSAVTNKLVKLSGAPSTATISGAGDTGGTIGVAFSVGGGNAVVQETGQIGCVFDGATTANHYVQISASVAGDCTDGGATYPTTGQVIGRVLSTNGGGGTYNIDLFSAEIQAASAGGVTSLIAGVGLSGGTITSTGTVAMKVPPIACTANSLTGGALTYANFTTGSGTSGPCNLSSTTTGVEITSVANAGGNVPGGVAEGTYYFLYVFSAPVTAPVNTPPNNFPSFPTVYVSAPCKLLVVTLFDGTNYNPTGYLNTCQPFIPQSAAAGLSVTAGGIPRVDSTTENFCVNTSLGDVCTVQPVASPTTGQVVVNIDNTGKQNLAAPIALTTTGTSGASTYSGGTLNIPQYAGGTGGGNTYLCNGSASANTPTCPGIPSGATTYTAMQGYFVAGATSTGAMTLNINSLGAVNVFLGGVITSASNTVTSGQMYPFYYDGTEIQLIPSVVASTYLTQVAGGIQNTGFQTAVHYAGQGTAPTVAAGGAIGTTPTITGTDFVGTVSVPSTAVTTGTIATVTFGTAYGTAPNCWVTQNGGTVSVGIGHGTPGTTSFTITAAVADVSAAAYLIDYGCSGK